jgi:hypothetical protein
MQTCTAKSFTLLEFREKVLVLLGIVRPVLLTLKDEDIRILLTDPSFPSD